MAGEIEWDGWLKSDLPKPQRSAVDVKPDPMVFVLWDGSVFDVTDVNAWGHMEDGYIATGAWRGDADHEVVTALLPYNTVKYRVMARPDDLDESPGA